MVTHAQIGTVIPNPRFNFHTSHISPIPKSPTIALFDPNWRVAMYDEYNALVKNNTWILVPKPPNANVFSLCGCLDISIMLVDLRVGTRLDLLPMAALTGMFMSQNKCTLELLDKDHMANCNPTRMPIDTESKLDSNGDLIFDPTLYRSLEGVSQDAKRITQLVETIRVNGCWETQYTEFESDDNEVTVADIAVPYERMKHLLYEPLNFEGYMSAIEKDGEKYQDT
ncbi:ribonuclease H-like domain-containing protein [Tanacetum coccineum]